MPKNDNMIFTFICTLFQRYERYSTNPVAHPTPTQILVIFPPNSNSKNGYSEKTCVVLYLTKTENNINYNSEAGNIACVYNLPSIFCFTLSPPLDRICCGFSVVAVDFVTCVVVSNKSSSISKSVQQINFIFISF